MCFLSVVSVPQNEILDFPRGLPHAAGRDVARRAKAGERGGVMWKR